MQMARSYQLCAGNGEIHPLTFTKLVAPAPGKQVISSEVAAQMRKMLEMVTLPGGTATRAQVVGYRVGGKTGQGGATLLQFEVGNAAGYFNTHSTRIATMKTRLAAIGVTNYKPIIILTIGLNDIGAGTTAANFKIKLANHISNLRYNLNMGNVPVIMPDFTSMPNWTTYNTAMTELTQTIPNIYVVSSSGATLKDVSHWDCAGYKLVMQRMMNVIVTM